MLVSGSAPFAVRLTVGTLASHVTSAGPQILGQSGELGQGRLGGDRRKGRRGGGGRRRLAVVVWKTVPSLRRWSALRKLG